MPSLKAFDGIDLAVTSGSHTGHRRPPVPDFSGYRPGPLRQTRRLNLGRECTNTW
jgi:hypothetical protein